MTRVTQSCVALVLCCLLGCAGDGSRLPRGTKRICVTVPPPAEVVEHLAGPEVAVDVFLAPGHSPATYEPSPAKMAALAETGMLFTIGVPFEKAVVPDIRDLYPELQVVDLSLGLSLLPMEHGVAHDHDHHHGSFDPHLWLDPMMMKQMAATVANHLTQQGFAHADTIAGRLAVYQNSMDKLDAHLRSILAEVSGQAMYVYHPSYGYFARRYGLRQVAVEVGGKEPGVQSLANFIEQSGAENVKAIFVQPQFAKQSAAKVAEAVGARLVELDPLARDYSRNMVRMATAIAGALGHGEEVGR